MGKTTNKPLSFQIFVEPKGKHLLETDRWKEDFLKQIENQSEIKIPPYLFKTKEYKLIGLPFYNECRAIGECRDSRLAGFSG